MAVPFAFATLITSDSYLPGALALVAALRDVHPSPPVPPQVNFQTLCLVTPESVDVSTIKLLRRAYDVVVGVEIIDQEDVQGLKLLGRPDLSHVLTKLHVFRLTQYSKVIFLDADILPIRPLSHLFNLPHEFSAVPDVGWPDIFNSGMMVLTPGEDKFQELRELAKTQGSWDGGDQGLLNEWRGQNWNRLSFTYNTTPTAAYTYAPAYERFGSQISAIHFIGPNKPWRDIPYRAPGSKEFQEEATGPQRAYNYSALVDRWYAVYDKHYRSQPVGPEPEFEVRQYTPAWDDSTHVGAEAGGAFGLEELKRMAVEGMGMYSGGVETAGERHEAEYRSLPLDGRFDLMRPRREEKQPEPDQGEDGQRTPTARHMQLPPGGPPAMGTLPTPGPNEVPPAPYHYGHSLPPTPWQPPPDDGRPWQPPPGDQLSWQQPPSGDGQYHQQPQQSSQWQLQPEQFDQSWEQHVQQHGQPWEQQHSQDQLWQQHQSHHQQGQSGQHHHHHHSSGQHHHQQHSPPHRPSSPPLVSWNPAVEPPPRTAPSGSAFPTDTYFPNVWDQAPSKQHDIAYQSQQPSSSSAHHEPFFAPPPPTAIPERLIREGHYTNVFGQAPQGPVGSPAAPLPDLAKVKTVFPWEEKPRHVPVRAFPSSDAPPPGTVYIEEQKAKPPESSELDRHVYSPGARSPVKQPPPTKGFPSKLAYTNAWDTVPQIQKYASKLVRPSQAAQPALPDDDDGFRRGYRSWETRSEASSFDGDDEGANDEDDDDDNVSRNGDESSRERSIPRSRRQSGSSSHGVLSPTRKEGKGTKYLVQGVQTIPREMRSKSVQVTLIGNATKGADDADQQPDPKRSPPRPALKTRGRTGSGGTVQKDWSPTIGPGSPAVATRSGSPALDSPALLPLPRPPVPTWETGSGMKSPRTFSPPMAASPKHSSPVHSPTHSYNRVRSPPQIGVTSPTPRPLISPQMMMRTSSNETGMASPLSSNGPVSPMDGQPVPSPARKAATRVWDPTRSVDIFKKGSEEVLARFLRMAPQSWDDQTGEHV
ncbi:glycosyltransferase family 8 protein [Neolentinus lepideus HHB14362 ss-1]|uniref:glycogenin glucosyltransferase n=1 Tax=Neolentinus lepideus HHB14362 ss-1 TaxID=1314782 RepID=A0A165W8M3_9AGAM|nr:glycosyltransferase family 8 protein [Neolentinus lepideus HHB14362 ss-1]